LSLTSVPGSAGKDSSVIISGKIGPSVKLFEIPNDTLAIGRNLTRSLVGQHNTIAVSKSFGVLPSAPA
jgi:hypothetical protein